MRIDGKRLKAVSGSASGWLMQFTGVGDRGGAGWGLLRREAGFWRLTGFGEKEGTEAESQVCWLRPPG